MTKNKNSWKNLSFIGLVQVVAFFTISLSTFSLFDQHHRYFELFTSFKFQYLLSSFACAVIFALYEKYKLAFLLLLIVGLNSIFITPWYFTDSENTPVGAQAELKILHSNVFTANL